MIYQLTPIPNVLCKNQRFFSQGYIFDRELQKNQNSNLIIVNTIISFFSGQKKWHYNAEKWHLIQRKSSIKRPKRGF